MARDEAQTKCHLGWPKKMTSCAILLHNKRYSSQRIPSILQWLLAFLGVPEPCFPQTYRWSIDSYGQDMLLKKTSYVGRGAENHGTVNFCAIWSIDFKSSEENMGMISLKGSLSWSILPEKNFWKLLSEAAGWKSDKMSFESSSCSCWQILNFNQGPGRGPVSSIRLSQLFGCQKKRLRQQYAAYGLNMCHLSWWQFGPARVWHSCTMDNGWRKSEKSTFLYKKFHALCSEQKTWKLDQLTSISYR